MFQHNSSTLNNGFKFWLLFVSLFYQYNLQPFILSLVSSILSVLVWCRFPNVIDNAKEIHSMSNKTSSEIRDLFKKKPTKQTNKQTNKKQNKKQTKTKQKNKTKNQRKPVCLQFYQLNIYEFLLVTPYSFCFCTNVSFYELRNEIMTL